MYSDIFPNEVSEWKKKNARLIDVREPFEFESGHVPGAENIPMNTIPEMVDQLEGPMVIICAAGGRSASVAEFLDRAGKTEVANMMGGTSGWIQAGLEVE